MKTTAIGDIKKQVDAFSKLVAEIESLNTRQGEAETKLASLIDSGDLADDQVLDAISRLHLFVKLFPARIEAREASVAEVKAGLLTLLDDFTGNDMRRRFHNLNALAKARVEPRLKPLFGNPGDLITAVNHAPEMAGVLDFWRKLDGCGAGGLLRAEPSATVALGQKILALWKTGEEIETRLQAKA